MTTCAGDVGRRTAGGAMARITASSDGKLYGVVNDAGLELGASWDAGSGINLDGISDWDLEFDDS